MVFGAGIAWPLAIAISRGYERANIGVGGDEMRAVVRAVVFAIAAGAVPSAVSDRPGVVAVCVIGDPDGRSDEPRRALRHPHASAPAASARARTSAG